MIFLFRFGGICDRSLEGPHSLQSFHSHNGPTEKEWFHGVAGYPEINMKNFLTFVDTKKVRIPPALHVAVGEPFG